MDLLLNPEVWVAFLTLLALEIVLGVDNIVFISILVGKLPEERQALARRLGLGMALVMRILLLLSLSWVIGLTAPLFTVLGQEISGRDLILILGGLFLLSKSTFEIHENLEGEEGHSSARVKATFASVLLQIVLIDMVFSLDSVITAVGMVNEVSVMIAAVTIAILVMLVAAEAVSNLVNRHPTLKMLALSFLLLIGFTLLLEGFGQHVPKGYIYFAMGFAVFVELLNMRARRRREARSHPVELRQRYARSGGEPTTPRGLEPPSLIIVVLGLCGLPRTPLLGTWVNKGRRVLMSIVIRIQRRSKFFAAEGRSWVYSVAIEGTRMTTSATAG